MWKIYKDFFYKEMKYENSCFPCSLHVILVNLGYIGYKYGNESVIEDLWNTFHKDLNKSAPNELQIHSYLMNTPYLDGRNSLYTPTSFLTKVDAENVCEKLKYLFFKQRKQVGMIAGIGHAHVFFKQSNKKYMHFYPAPDIDVAFTEEVEIIDFTVLEGNNEYAIGVVYAKEQEEIQPANFILVVEGK